MKSPFIASLLMLLFVILTTTTAFAELPSQREVLKTRADLVKLCRSLTEKQVDVNSLVINLNKINNQVKNWKTDFVKRQKQNNVQDCKVIIQSLASVASRLQSQRSNLTREELKEMSDFLRNETHDEFMRIYNGVKL